MIFLVAIYFLVPLHGLVMDASLLWPLSNIAYWFSSGSSHAMAMHPVVFIALASLSLRLITKSLLSAFIIVP